MRVARGRARFETRDPPVAGQLERSPSLVRHLRNEGSSVSREELLDRDGKHMLHMLPPICAVQSPRDAHHPHTASLKGQVDDGDKLRAMSEPRRRRVQMGPGYSARFVMAPLSQRKISHCSSRAHLRFCPPPWGKTGGQEKPVLPVPYPPYFGRSFKGCFGTSII